MNAERFITDSPRSPVSALVVDAVGAGAACNRMVPRLNRFSKASATHVRQRNLNLSQSNTHAEGTEK